MSSEFSIDRFPVKGGMLFRGFYGEESVFLFRGDFPVGSL